MYTLLNSYLMKKFIYIYIYKYTALSWNFHRKELPIDINFTEHLSLHANILNNPRVLYIAKVVRTTVDEYNKHAIATHYLRLVAQLATY